MKYVIMFWLFLLLLKLKPAGVICLASFGFNADSLPPISKKSASKFSDLASNKFMKGNVNKGWCVTLWPCQSILKSILRQKKNYGNSNISPCNNIFFKTSSENNQNPSRYCNSMTNVKFEHMPKYHLSKILI